MQKAVRWHPPAYDVRVEWIPIPEIQHPDDAIVKVKYTGLCGSDLHVYRGHGVNVKVHTIGHEFVGEVVALGSGFGPHASGRPSLYASLQVGHKVVCPFSTNCGECHFVGFDRGAFAFPVSWREGDFAEKKSHKPINSPQDGPCPPRHSAVPSCSVRAYVSASVLFAKAGILLWLFRSSDCGREAMVSPELIGLSAKTTRWDEYVE
ncbi:hypothetical protein ONZ45_g10165 [Pleurotus djamor]|nr:hypothetical protein ONZ45_g10165 [Pleurotus djamor]